MKYIRIVPKMRYAGRDGKGEDGWISTLGFVKAIVSRGRTMNTGLNVLMARGILDACEELMDNAIKLDGGKIKLKSKYIPIEDEWYNVFMSDLKVMNFNEVGLIGLAFAADVREIANPLSAKPKDDGELEFEYVGKPEEKKEEKKA